MYELREEIYLVNNIKLNVLEAGPPDGQILLFLHGFPEFSFAWKKQLSYFASKGYHVLAPDQRGYNKSSKPSGIKPYKMEHLVSDIVELIIKTTQRKVILTGHDWGGAVAWALAGKYPQLLEKLIIMNLPHPQVIKEGFKNWPKQIFKSSYIAFFQIPWLPEIVSSAANYRLLEGSMHKSSNKNTFSPSMIDEYKKAWQQPGALRSMINWYRAMRYKFPDSNTIIEVPTLLIWGKRDQFLSHEMARPSIEKCQQGKLIMMEDATHWLHHEKSREINQEIEKFITN